MRVLITTPAGFGHVNPMVPLARAVAARGHEILWAVPASGVGPVEQAGFRAVAAGAPTSIPEAFRQFPELKALGPAEVGDVMFGKLFGALGAPPMLADLVPVAVEWKPDLVVADAAELAGHIVAAELGVPSITKGFGPTLPEVRVARAGDEVAPLWRSRGLEPRPYGGAYDHLYLDVYPLELETPATDHIPRQQLLRPVAYDGEVQGAPTPALPDGPADAPLVYVTMGTVFNDPGPLETVLSALADLPVRVLVTVGPQADPSVLTAQPAHVRVERYVPQTLVLPRADLVISHAGSGTVLATLALGLPQLCLGQGADQFLNAVAVASGGAGISLMPGDQTADAVRGAVVRLLDDPSYREAACRVRDSIASMPAPDDVAAVLETLT